MLVGVLPSLGTGSLSAQAQLVSDRSHQEHAATRIQAAYRGHSVRQKLDWSLPSARTLAGCLRAEVQGAGPKVCTQGWMSSSLSSLTINLKMMDVREPYKV